MDSPLISFINEIVILTNREYRQLSDISDEGARIDLKEIIEKKVFKAKGRGRSFSYVLASGD